MTKKNEYMALCSQQNSEFLQSTIESPTRHMRPIHIAIIMIVLRRRIA